MLKKRIIPCLDVRDGRVVKGIRFETLRDSGDPVELAQSYVEQGADELVMLDVSATTEGRLALLETVEKIRRVLSIPLTVGGGVKTLADGQRLLRSGADKVSINSAAVQRPEVIDEFSAALGAQCTVVAIDVLRTHSLTWEVVTHSGRQRTGRDAVAWAIEAQRRGAGEILLTSMDRDGTGTGYDLELLQEITSAIPLPTIASGGARTVDHLLAAFQAGAHAVLAASIFHFQQLTVGQVKAQLAEAGVEVRRC